MMPEIGKHIKVVCRNHNLGFVVWRPETSEYTGTVIEKFWWTGPDEFCMTTGLVNFPIRTIKMDDVSELVDSKGKKTILPKTVPAPINPKKTEWIVSGSKGNKYVVSRNGNVWSCTCVHGQFRKSACKHIKEIQSKGT